MKGKQVIPLIGLMKGAGLTFIGLLATAFFGFIFRVEIARMLGPEEYGLISLAIVVFSISISFVDFGTPSAIVRYVSFYRANKDKISESAIIGTGLRFGV